MFPNKISINPSYRCTLKNFDETLYCSKLSHDNKSVIINGGTFKLTMMSNYIYLEFIKNIDTYYEINAMEDKLINELYENSSEIFGLQVSKNNISNLFKKSINLPKNLNTKPYLKMRLSKNLSICINGVPVSDPDQISSLDCNKVRDNVNASIKFKKLIFCKDSIVLDLSCVKLDFIDSDDSKEMSEKGMTEDDDINDDAIISNNNTINNMIDDDNLSDPNDSIELDDEILTCLDNDELLEANSMINITERSY